ncbi:hypothetical protein IFM89_018969 [Coptis chinensis]|uniref:Uncharacterized protein n=2 Tax=Coptis chinensis TaxID=261450 RepID=A0A835I3F1_9MAGN|nr:hypothetical protein IFM89_018969 [Coptis chinensis]
MNFTKLLISTFSTSSSSSPTRTSHFLANYLMKNFNFSEPRALSASKRFWWAKNPDNIETVVTLLKQHGFSDAHIESTVKTTPQILFAKINKTLIPKLKFFQENLGLRDSDLGLFLSKNATLFTQSLERKLIPNTEILLKILSGDRKALIWIIGKCKWILYKFPKSSLLVNIGLLEKYGIVGSQLSMIVKSRPILLVLEESKLCDLCREVERMGFSSKSRMFVHGLLTLSCMSSETIRNKLEVFQSFGYSKEECVGMFRKAPGMPRVSVEKLRLGLEFFLKGIGFERDVLLRMPRLLMYSMEKRVIPRYFVLEILKSKKLLKRNTSFVNVIQLSEDEFLDKYISKYRDNAEELLIAYKGGLANVDTSEESDRE